MLALIVDSVGNGLFAPLSLVYFIRLTDVPLALVGVLLTVANLVALPIPIWAGALADRIGPLRLVVASEVAMAAGFLAVATVRGPIGILGAATLGAVGVRVFWCVIFTLIADYADGRAGGRSVDAWYAISNAARTAGLALGGLATGLAVADGSDAAYRAIAYGAAACLALAAVLVATCVRAPHRVALDDDRVGYRALLRDRPYLGLVALNTVYAMTSMMLPLALPVVVLTGAGPPWLASVLFAANAVLITVLSAPLVRRLSGVRRTRSIAVAAGLWTLWCLLLAVVGVSGPGIGATVLLVVGTVAFTVAEAVHAPTSTALAAAAAPIAARGRYLATFQYSFAVASVIAPAFFGALYAAGHATPFLVLGAIDALSVFALFRLERSLRSPTPRRS